MRPDLVPAEAMSVRQHMFLRPIVAAWYASNPEIVRVWVYETDGVGNARIAVVVALDPVCDSDEITPVWLSRCNAWQRELQALLGDAVRLDWLDARWESVPCWHDTGNCLANIGWRDYSDDTLARHEE